MSDELGYCECGHASFDHRPGVGCMHVNAASKRFPLHQPCTCRRFAFDDRLRSSEDFIAKVLEKVRAKEAIAFEPVERDEALQVLRIALWKTSAKYDSRSHVRFRVYAYLELYNDAIDHIRSERGRHGQHRLLDHRHVATALEELDDDVDGAPRADRLEGTPSRDPHDDPDAWAADAGGLLAEGDGAPAEPRRVDGRDDAPRDPRRDPRPVPRTSRRARAARSRARRAARRVDDDGDDHRVAVEPSL